MPWKREQTYRRSLVLSIGLVVLGCSGEVVPDRAGEVTPGRAGLTTRDALIVIEMTDDMDFAPGDRMVAVGDTIVWVNRGSLPHTTTARSDYLPLEELPATAAPWDSGLMDSNDEFRVVVRAKGLYRYVCTLHQAAGMVAEFRVE